MKQSQWTLAIVLFAGMVFVIVFAMNHLGGSSAPVHETKQNLELLFATKELPNDPQAPLKTIELEEKSTGFQDYWFCNTNDKPVRIGLNSKNCKCTNVEAYYLPEDVSRRIVADARALVSADELAQAVKPYQDDSELKSQATRKALETPSDYLSVPPGRLGWVRLNYKGEKPGPQLVSAAMWMEERDTGALATLQLKLTFHEIFQVDPNLEFGTHNAEDLVAGVIRHVLCFSITRPNLTLEARASRSRGSEASDPLVVGKVEPLTEAERQRLQDRMSGLTVKCAYKIPVTLTAVSRDGTTPFDLGPFHRRLLIWAKEDPGEPKSVLLQGRILGLIDVLTEEESGVLNFGSFARSAGKRMKVTLTSDTPGVQLQVDNTRMPEFLKASLSPVEGRRSWILNLEVLPNRASGIFPRPDPTYEDSAVYLKATVPGQPPRSLRLGVSGTASGG